jgi:FKBP-type peptidyl-prolyl cis-trans isomerase 2
MTQVKDGDTVRVRYTGRLADGRTFDTSADRGPLEFTVGGGKVLAGFEQAVVGMAPGESKTVEIPTDQAYGPWRREKVIAVDRASFPENIEPQVGQRLEIQRNGRRMTVLVTGVTEYSVRLDANHPLVGKDLIFDIEIVEIT